VSHLFALHTDCALPKTFSFSFLSLYNINSHKQERIRRRTKTSTGGGGPVVLGLQARLVGPRGEAMSGAHGDVEMASSEGYMSDGSPDRKSRKRMRGERIEGGVVQLHPASAASSSSVSSSSSPSLPGPPFKLRRPPHSRTKAIMDPVHLMMEFPAALVAVMDTPEFQRLKSLKQLGATSFVYPGAVHSRFEHSLGVSHLAMTLVKQLRSKQPDLGINDTDVLCAGLAGLCHDLGHGPFSHLFDGEFIRGAENWTHEKGSVKMLRHLLQVNDIRMEVMYGIGKRDLLFVEEMILGDEIEEGILNRQGRPSEKVFLYDIVNNVRSGFDVDKLDYIMRDAKFTGISLCMNSHIDRLFKLARVMKDERGIPTIAFPEKAVGQLYQVFDARFRLHKEVYQHKVVKACELMVRDILRLADPVLKFMSSLSGKMMKMSEAIRDMSVFTQLKDSVLDLIEIDPDAKGKLREAKELLWRLRSRDLYKPVGEKILERKSKNSNVRELQKEIWAEMEEIADLQKLARDSFIVEVTRMHRGKLDKNPIEMMRFYNKASIQGNYVSPRHQGGSFFFPGFSQNSVGSQESIAENARCFQIDPTKYSEGLLPAAMDALEVRVYSRFPERTAEVQAVLATWSRMKYGHSPLFHTSQEYEREDEVQDQPVSSQISQRSNVGIAGGRADGRNLYSGSYESPVRFPLENSKVVLDSDDEKNSEDGV